ncbi:hypothetical protein Nmel_004547 [Mimus melanotis]
MAHPHSSPALHGQYIQCLQSLDERLRRRLGLSHCFLAASSQYSWSFCLVKQKHVVIKITQLTELGPRAEAHQIEQLLVHQRYSAVHQRKNITLLKWEQPVQRNPYLELAFVPGSMLTPPAMPLPGVPAPREVSFQRGLVFMRASLVH